MIVPAAAEGEQGDEIEQALTAGVCSSLSVTTHSLCREGDSQRVFVYVICLLGVNQTRTDMSDARVVQNKRFLSVLGIHMSYRYLTRG